jgi:hypothetical protein
VPPLGHSTLMTSAPKSAKFWVHHGPAGTRDRSQDPDMRQCSRHWSRSRVIQGGALILNVRAQSVVRLVTGGTVYTDGEQLNSGMGLNQ